MIFLGSVKMWNKFKKKYVEPKDYMLLDATDDETSKLNKFTNMVDMANFAVPSGVLKLVSEIEDDESLDYDRLEEMERNFFEGYKFRSSVVATISVLVSERVNVFIIVRNKAFKYYRKRFKSEFCKVIPELTNYFHILHDDANKDKKYLNEEFSDKEIETLQKKVQKKEKEMEDEAKKMRSKRKKKRKKGWGI